MQVTAQVPAGTAYGNVVLKVYVCTGVTETGGAVVTRAISFTTPPEFSLTPAHSGSLVVAALSNVANGTETWTPAANNTTDDTGTTAVHPAGYWYGHYTGTVTGGTPVTLGCTETTNNFFAAAGFELPASGSPAIDASTPAAVSGSTVLVTSGRFTPIANSVLVAVVLGNPGTSGQTVSVIDNSGLGLTWTQRGLYTAAFSGTAAVFTATLPGSIPASHLLQSASAQGQAVNPAASVNVTATYPSNLTAGSKMVAYVQASDPAVGVYPAVTVADANSVPFELIAQSLDQDFVGHNTRLSVWALDTTAADAGTKPAITATLTGTASDGGIYGTLLIQELSGQLPARGSSPLDGIPVNFAPTGGSGGNFSSGSPPYSSSAANEYLISAYCDDGAFQTAGGCTWTAPPLMQSDVNSVNSSAGGDLAVSAMNSTGGLETGSYAVTVPVAGTNWCQITAAFQPSGAALAVNTVVLLPARASKAYSFQLAASGGSGPYAWSVSAGSLPVWASLDAVTGIISGTAPAGAGSATFTVKATDRASATATKPVTLTVITAADTTTSHQHNYVTPSQSAQITGNRPGINAATPYTNPNMFNPVAGATLTMNSYTASNWDFAGDYSNSSGSVVAYPSTGFYYSQNIDITDYPYLVSGWNANMDWSALEYGSGIIASMAYDLWFTADQSSEVMIHPFLQSRGSGPWVTGPVVFGGYPVNVPGVGNIFIPPQYWRLSFSAGASTSYWIKVNASGVPEWPGLPVGVVDVLAMLKYLVNPLGIWPGGRLPSWIGFGFGFEVCSTQGVSHDFSINDFFWYGPTLTDPPLEDDDSPWHIRRRR